MPRAKTTPAPELTLEQRRERRKLRREKQRDNNAHRAAKMRELAQSDACCYATRRLWGQDYEIAYTLATSLIFGRRSKREE